MNLLSEHSLQLNQDCTIIGEKGRKRIFRFGKKLAELVEFQGVWWIDIIPQKSPLIATNSVMDQTTLWHRRLRHISLKKLLKTQRMVREPFSVTKYLHFCDYCVQGKQTRNPIAKTSGDQPSKVLERLNFDSVDAESTSRRGKKGFVLVTDSVSQFRWVHCYRKKSEIPERLVAFLKELAVNSTHNLMTVRSSNGTGLLMKQFSRIFVLLE